MKIITQDNAAAENGGAIYISGLRYFDKTRLINLEYSTFAQNSAISGGSIYIKVGDFNMISLTFGVTIVLLSVYHRQIQPNKAPMCSSHAHQVGQFMVIYPEGEFQPKEELYI